MSIYKRANREAWFVAVPTSNGRVKRSTGTTHRATARAIERMLESLGPTGQRAWDLLDRVATNALSLGDLYDAWRTNDLERLRQEVNGNADLEPHVEAWSAWLTDYVKPDTASHYTTHVRTLITSGKPYLQSEFTSANIAKWLAQRTALVQKRRPSRKGNSRRQQDPPARAVSGATKRKYLAAVASFGNYLVEIGVLTRSPVGDVKAPKGSRPRVVEIELRDVLRIVEGAQAPYDALFALLYGAGIEISAALACVESDVDLRKREVRARGTKAHARDRVVRVANWACPHLKKHLATLTPGERLFRGFDRWQVGKVHRDRLVALGLPHHRLHDARHFMPFAPCAPERRTSSSRGSSGTLTCRWSPVSTGDMRREAMNAIAGRTSPRNSMSSTTTEKIRKWVPTWVPLVRTIRANHP